MQTLHVSTKEGQVGVWGHVMLGTMGRVGVGEGTCGRRLQCDGTEEERRWGDTRRRATAAHRPLARNTPPPSAETSRSRHHSEGHWLLRFTIMVFQMYSFVYKS